MTRVAALLAVVVVLLGFAAAPDVVTLLPSKGRPSVEELPLARFSHQQHKPLGCHGCHPGVFTTPRARPTHAEMKAGHHCGACHDGRQARSFKQLGCKSCHVEKK